MSMTVIYRWLEEGVENNNDDDLYEEQKWCKVYDKNDFFTLFVQILLAAMALFSLYFKRLREVPRRTFRTWFLDIGKQAAGACYAHILNMIIAAIISGNIRGESELKDQCAWYGMSYLIDTTMGLLLAIIFLALLDYFANEHDWVHLKHSGVYSGPNGLWHWVSQVFAWLAILTIVKVFIYLFMWFFSEQLAIFGGWLFKPLQGNIRFELLFVMIVFPGLLNVIYFWIADGFLKAKKEHSDAHESDGMEDKKEHLIESETELPEGNYKPAAWSSVGGQGDSSKPGVTV